MSVDNRTPFPALAFRQYNLEGELAGIVVARGTFRLTNNGPLMIAEEQHPLVMSDTYEGDPHKTPQLACTDLAPFKPGTDVTFLGAAFPPGGVASSSWNCGLTVGPVSKRLRVHGPRVWRAHSRKTWRGLLDRTKEDALDHWELTEGEPIEYLSLDWRLAFGDLDANESGTPLARNPIGRDVVDQQAYLDRSEWPAPQIEDEAHPILSVGDRPAPAGLGPLSPFWKDRAERAGTYDDKWLKERHPLLPTDFDYRFWQAAHPDLVAEPWLQGDEAFELQNLLPGWETLKGRLPNIGLYVEIDQKPNSSEGWMVLDGVHFDMRPGVGRVFLTWRCNFPWPERQGLPKISMVNLSESVS
jgi:hypothetical protein